MTQDYATRKRKALLDMRRLFFVALLIVLWPSPKVGAAPETGTIREIVQEHEAFVPRVAAVTRGSTVSFPNADPIFHNVFSLSGAGPFDLGHYPSSQMSASIVVFDHPFFAAPDATGSFALRDVPPGQYTIVGWHERIGERTRPIEVIAGQSVDVTLSLPVEELK